MRVPAAVESFIEGFAGDGSEPNHVKRMAENHSIGKCAGWQARSLLESQIVVWYRVAQSTCSEESQNEIS
jgi:hypothetical protein